MSTVPLKLLETVSFSDRIEPTIPKVTPIALSPILQNEVGFHRGDAVNRRNFTPELCQVFMRFGSGVHNQVLVSGN